MGLSPTIHVLGRPMAVPGPFFFEAPTETVGRRPCSHGGGPLRELDGQCPPSPIAGSPVPCSALAGAAPEHQRYAGTHRPPAQRLPPSATGPREGGPLATDRRCSGASACRFASPLRRGPRPPAPLASGYRRLCPPVAPPPSRPPTACARGCAPAPVPPGHLVLRLTLGLLRVGLRPALRAAAGSPPALLRRSLGGSPQDGPCSSWLVARSPRSATSAGLRAPLLPPGAWSGPAGRFFTAPAPGDGSRCSQGLASGFWLAQAGRLPPALCQLCQLILLASTGNLFVSYNGNG